MSEADGMATTPKRSLAIKLCQVMAASGYVEKRGQNQKQGYKYATEADVLNEIRKELAKVNVFIFPTVLEQVRTLHGKTSGGFDNFMTDVVVKWTFVDGDSGEQWECTMPGCGVDTGDKGLYKAITGSSKYMFLKAFMLPTGDDPEEDKLTKEDIEEGKTAARGVAAAKLRKIADKAGNTAVALVEWKEGWVAVSGDNGLAILKAEVEPDELKTVGFRKDDNVLTIPAGNAFIFEDLCKRAKIDVHWAQSAKKAVS